MSLFLDSDQVIFWVTVVGSSGLVGAISGGLVSHFSIKALDASRRFMEVRKIKYTEISELFSGLFSTETSMEVRLRTGNELLTFHREMQLWGSDEVTRQFNGLLKVFNDKSVDQDLKNSIYRQLIIAMRTDLLGKTELIPDEIVAYGKMVD